MTHEERMALIAKLVELQVRAASAKDSMNALAVEIDACPPHDVAGNASLETRALMLKALALAILRAMRKITDQLGLPFAGVRVPDEMPEHI